MAARKTGPVKPPILDLKARETSKGKADASPVSVKKPTTKKTAPQNPAKSSITSDIKEKSSAAKTPDNPDSSPESSSPVSKSFASKPAADSASSSQTAPPRSGLSTSLAALVGIAGGALLGTLATIFLFLSGILQIPASSEQSQKLQDLSDRIGINGENITQSLVGFNVMDEQVAALRLQLEQQSTVGLPGNQTQLDQLTADLSQVQSQIASLADRQLLAETDTPVAFDPAPLRANLATLSSRIDAINAGVPDPDAGNIAADLVQNTSRLASVSRDLIALQTSIAALIEQVSALSNLSDTNQQNLTRIQQQSTTATDVVNSLQNQLDQISDAPVIAGISPINLQLPLAILGLETALANGRPFAPELASISAIFPELNVPENLLQFADQGLLRPEQLARQFNLALPKMLAARPNDPDAGWQDNLWQRVRSLFAVRPSDELEGDSIEARFSQAEAAANRRDFVALSEALTQLPDVMKAPLGDLLAQIQATRSALNLLSEVRSSSLVQPTGIAPGSSEAAR